MWKKEHLRIAQDVAQMLRGEILAGHYHAGDKLPPERKLAETFGINRATLREAIKQLEHMGLVRSRQGDGTRVLDFLQSAGLELLRYLFPVTDPVDLVRHIGEFRQVIGREIAGLAAERCTSEQIAALEAIAGREVRTLEEAITLDFAFYMELARATGNTVFILLLNSVRPTLYALAPVLANFSPKIDLMRDHHQLVLAALRAHDVAAARRAANAHLERGKDHMLGSLGGPEVLAPAAATEQASPVELVAAGKDPRPN